MNRGIGAVPAAMRTDPHINGNGDELIIDDVMDARLFRPLLYGMKKLEVFYSGYSVKLQKDALSLACRCDLLVTAGNDYHGKTIP